MNAAIENTWRMLLDAGLVTNSTPPVQTLESPWYVRLLLGITGWMAALFLLGFVATGLAWIIRTESVSALAGVMMIATAWLMLARFSRNAFAVQFALAMSFAGQVLFAVGVFGWFGLEQGDTLAWLVMTLAQVTLAAVMPNTIHRLWSAAAAAIAFSMLLHSIGLSFMAPACILALAAWAWLNEFAWVGFSKAIRPMAYGLVLALVSMDMAGGTLQPLTGMGVTLSAQNINAPWLSQLLPGAVLLSVVWVLLRRWKAAVPGKVSNMALLGTALLVLASLKAPGVSSGVCIVLLGYAHGNRVLTGLGMAALLLYLSTYYYTLEETLLVKSQVLALSGAAVLALRWLMLRWLPRKEAPDEK